MSDDHPTGPGNERDQRPAETPPGIDAGFREFIDRCPDAVFVRCGDMIVHANEALLRLLGAKRADVEGKDPATAFVHPYHRAGLLEHRQAAPDGTDLREYRWLRKDGEVVDVEVVGITATFEGSPARICMCRDLTERRKMQTKLLVTGHMASAGTLAAGLAHEIGDPLAAMLANLRLTAKRLKDAGPSRLAEASKTLTDVIEAAERIRGIVDRLRTFSHVDDARQDRLELRRVVEEALELAAGELRDRARLVKDLQPVGSVEANEGRLIQLFVNLLVNAAQAIPPGKAGTNEIHVQTRREGASKAALVVRDTGVGIAADKLAHIFDPFFTTKWPSGCAGLGLSVCHNVITRLGGELTVTSRPGLGTTVTVVLPATP